MTSPRVFQRKHWGEIDGEFLSRGDLRAIPPFSVCGSPALRCAARRGGFLSTTLRGARGHSTGALRRTSLAPRFVRRPHGVRDLFRRNPRDASRARGDPPRARARVASVTRADGSAQASTCVVTPATVAQRSGSASVKGTVRKQNEDRFASYVRTPALPPVSPPPRAPRRRPLTTRRSILPDRRSTDDPRARPVFPRLTRSASSPSPPTR